MKRCPLCAEEIQDAAIKCRHCGSMLAEASASPGSTTASAASPSVAPTATIFEGRPSWKAQFWSIAGATLLLTLGLLMAPILHLAFAAEWTVALVVGGAGVLLGAVWWFGLWISRATLRFHITTRAIDVESGLLSKNIETLQLWKVRDIEFRQTLSDRLFGASRVRVFTRDVTTPQFDLWGLPGSRHVFERLKDAIEIARQSRNVIGLVD